jgi:hypothetical protein
VIRTHKLPIKYSPPTLFLFLDFIPTCLDLESITITESMTISFFSNVIVTFLPLARCVRLCFSIDLVFYFLYASIHGVLRRKVMDGSRQGEMDFCLI